MFTYVDEMCEAADMLDHFLEVRARFVSDQDGGRAGCHRPHGVLRTQQQY